MDNQREGAIISRKNHGDYNFSDGDLYNGTVTVQNVALTAKFNGAAETTDPIGLDFALWGSSMSALGETGEVVYAQGGTESFTMGFDLVIEGTPMIMDDTSVLGEPVPEPTSLALFLCGIGGFVVFGYRKKSRQMT